MGDTMNNKELTSKLLCNFSLLHALTEQQLDLVMKSSSQITVAKGEKLFSAGEEASYFFLLRRGRIKLFLISSNLTEKIVEFVNPGESFALAVMFMEERHYPVHAEALKDSLVCAFSSATFLNILRGSCTTSFRVMAELSSRLREQVLGLDRFGVRCAPTLLASYLLKRSRETGSSSVTLGVPKREISSLLSIQPETFSRALKSLKEREIIREEPKGLIHIIDFDELTRTIERCSINAMP